jgi:hypothetical protein
MMARGQGYVPGRPTSFRLDDGHLKALEDYRIAHGITSRNLALRHLLDDLRVRGVDRGRDR